MYGSASQWQAPDYFQNSGTSLRAPYTFTNILDIDRIEAPYSWPHVGLDKALDTIRSTTSEDVGPSSQLDEDARTTGADDPNARGWQPSFHNLQANDLVLFEPQTEKISFPATFSESYTCSTCKLELPSRSAYR